MEQRMLMLRNQLNDISEDIIKKAKTFKDALKLAKELSGLTDLQFCQELNIDTGHWSRIWQSKANFPEEKLIAFMNLCNNIVPLRWLAMIFNFELSPIKEAWEIENEQLRKELENERLKLQAIHDFLRDKGLRL